MKIFSILRTLFSSNKHPLKIKGIYKGRLCELCGAIVKGGTKAQHFKAYHPEYALRTDYSHTSAYYFCGTCGSGVSAMPGLIEHYKQYHPEKIKG